VVSLLSLAIAQMAARSHPSKAQIASPTVLTAFGMASCVHILCSELFSERGQNLALAALRGTDRQISAQISFVF